MKEPEKLTIRVNFKPQHNNITKVETVYHYHWARIIGASLAVVIAIGSLVAGSAYYFKQDNAYNKQTKTPLINAADLISTNTISSLSITKDKAPVASFVIPDQVADGQEALQKNIAQNTITVDVKRIEDPKANPVILPIITSITEDTPPSKELVITATDKSQLESFQTSKNETLINTVPLFKQSKAQVFSNDVTRFIISSSVIEHEPIGNINDIIFDNNIATVYAFSEVNNLKDSTLYYLWNVDGKDVAKVKVSVGGNRWRSHSSKFIQANMQGEWTVELQNEKGEILATNRFYYQTNHQ